MTVPNSSDQMTNSLQNFTIKSDYYIVIGHSEEVHGRLVVSKMFIYLPVTPLNSFEIFQNDQSRFLSETATLLVKLCRECAVSYIQYVIYRQECIFSVNILHFPIFVSLIFSLYSTFSKNRVNFFQHMT